VRQAAKGNDPADATTTPNSKACVAPSER